MRQRRYRKVRKTVWVFSLSAIIDNPNPPWYETSEHLRNERQVYASKELAMHYKREYERQAKKHGDNIIIQVKPVTFDVFEIVK